MTPSSTAQLNFFRPSLIERVSARLECPFPFSSAFCIPSFHTCGRGRNREGGLCFRSGKMPKVNFLMHFCATFWLSLESKQDIQQGREIPGYLPYRHVRVVVRIRCSFASIIFRKLGIRTVRKCLHTRTHEF